VSELQRRGREGFQMRERRGVCESIRAEKGKKKYM